MEATTQGNTALYIAAQRGHFHIVKILIKAGANLKTLYKNKYPPLFIAAANGHTKVVSLLLPHYTLQEVDAFCEDDCTALYVAAQNGHADIVDLLLEIGANLQLKYLEDTPLHIAVQNRHTNVVKVMSKTIASWPYSARVKYVNMRGFDNKLSLYHASQNGDDISVKILIALSANPNLLFEEKPY